MLTPLLRILLSSVVQILWTCLVLVCLLYSLLFHLQFLKEMFKEPLSLITFPEVDENCWFVKEGKWKTIWHWAFKIK